jgi:ribokinase
VGYGVEEGLGVRVSPRVGELVGGLVDVAAILDAIDVWVLLKAGAGTVSVRAAPASVIGLAGGVWVTGGCSMGRLHAATRQQKNTRGTILFMGCNQSFYFGAVLYDLFQLSRIFTLPIDGSLGYSWICIGYLEFGYNSTKEDQYREVKVPAHEYDILTIGDMNVDLVFELGEVIPQFGQVEQWVPDYFQEMGGSACIFACQAAKLGLRVAILGRVGPDSFGELMLHRLGESGVDTRFVHVDPKLKTGLGLALCRPDGDRAILTYAGSLNAVYPEDITDDFLRLGRHLHYCSYYLQTNLLPAVPGILQRAKSLGLTVSLDTNWDPDETWDGGLHSCLRVADVFLPNEQEARAITRCENLPGAVQQLVDLGPLTVVKMGNKGVLVAGRGLQLTVPVETVTHPIDTVGAGDSFDGGFIAAWLRGLPLGVCAAIGNACGRANILARGGIAGQLWRADLPQIG